MMSWTSFEDQLMWALRIRRCVDLNEVFTPGAVADINYVRRPKLENSMRINIKKPGIQLMVIGHSGSGKTTIVQKVLKEEGRNCIVTPCSKNSTFEDLLLSAFDDLNPYYIDSVKSVSEYKISSSLQAEYAGIKGGLTGEHKESIDQQIKRALPIQLNAKKLASFLGEIHACWVIEDFHKLNDSEKQKLADSLKLFVDQGSRYPEMKMICIGVVGSVHDLLEYDTNLNTRISEVEVALLSDEENRQLIENGCKLLHVKMDGALINDIITYSNRIASVAHQMCSDICYKNGVDCTQKHEVSLSHEKFADALESYIESQSDRLRYLYEGAIKADVGWYILRTLANSGWEKVSLDGILKAANQNHKKKEFTRSQVLEKLRELAVPEKGIVKYDSNADKYSLASPFWGAFIKMQQRIEYNKSQKRKKKVLVENKQGLDAILHNMILQELHRLYETGAQ